MNLSIDAVMKVYPVFDIDLHREELESLSNSKEIAELFERFDFFFFFFFLTSSVVLNPMMGFRKLSPPPKSFGRASSRQRKIVLSPSRRELFLLLRSFFSLFARCSST